MCLFGKLETILHDSTYPRGCHVGGLTPIHPQECGSQFTQHATPCLTWADYHWIFRWPLSSGWVVSDVQWSTTTIQNFVHAVRGILCLSFILSSATEYGVVGYNVYDLILIWCIVHSERPYVFRTMHHRKRAFSHTLNVSIWNIISTVHPYNMFIRYVSPLTWRYYIHLTYLHDKPGMDWGEHCVANGCPCRLIVSFVFPQHFSLLGMMVPLRFTFSCRRRLRYGAVTRTSAFLRIVPIQRLVIWVLWKQCKLKILITPPSPRTCPLLDCPSRLLQML